MIEISAPARLTVKWLGENKKYITSVTGDFKLSEVWPSIKNIKNIKDIKPGGMRYSYYEGEWPVLPDFSKLKAVQSGLADSSFSLDKLPAQYNFACVFEGYIKIAEDGYYIFAVSSSDGSKFFINDHEIINNDGLHGNDFYKSYVVPLQTGFYPLRIEYFQNKGKRRLDCIYLSPNSHETVNMNFKMMYFTLNNGQ